jgi:iron complex transport system substrate-binding protein
VRAHLAAALVAAMLLGVVGRCGAAPPHRIVSANLCADRLVLALANRADIVSVSRYATDPAMSTVVAEVRGLPQNRADAEEIAALHPDLVVLGTSQTSRTTAAMLGSLGIPVHVVPAARSLAGVAAAIRGVATALGQEARGEAMIAQLEARIAGIGARGHGARAAVYLAGGWSSGRNTLADELLTRAGFVNIAAERGISGLGGLPLESLLASKPDLLVFETIGDTGPSLSGALLDNPVLAASGARILRMPARVWACPDPAVAEAALRIAAAAP